MYQHKIQLKYPKLYNSNEEVATLKFSLAKSPGLVQQSFSSSVQLQVMNEHVGSHSQCNVGQDRQRCRISILWHAARATMSHCISLRDMLRFGVR